MSVAGLDRFAGWLWRLPHLSGAERDDTLRALREHAGELVALDHLPEIRRLHDAFLADPSREEPLREALLAERARHDAVALRECQRALVRWAATLGDDARRARAEAEALASRWPPLARDLVDYRALEGWLRDGSARGLRAASELTMRWEDTAHATPPRRWEGRIEATHVDVEALAERWARVLDEGFTVGEAPRVVTWQGPPSLRWDRSVTRLGARYGMVSSSSGWFEGPGDGLACWRAFARPLGIGPDAWMVVSMRGDDEEPGAGLLVECSAPAAAMRELAARFAAREADGGP